MSKNSRLWHCGRHLVDERGTSVAVKNGGAYYVGVQTCGSIWLCPVCSARIRQRRALEIEAALLVLLEHGSSALGTFTFPHIRTDQLRPMLKLLQAAWKAVQQNSRVRRLLKRLGVFGKIRSTEVTWGAWHGWHPHLHVLFLAEGKLDEEQWDELRAALSDAWAAAVVKLGAGRPGDQVGVTLGAVYRSTAGSYLAKVQDHYGEASTVGREMARGDAKRGRKRSRTPFELAEQAVAGVVPELPLWWEYEQATYNVRAIEWSRGLKARFAVEEVDDEQLAAAEVDGDQVAYVDGQQWELLVKYRQETHVLDLAEDGGGAAVHEFLSSLQRMVILVESPTGKPDGPTAA